MVVIKNYSENYLKKDSTFQREPEIDEERAYVVGIWVIVIIAALLLLLLAVIVAGKGRNSEELAKKEAAQQEVLGEKQKTTSDSAKKSTAEVKTQSQDSANDTQNASNVASLERPLTEAETLEKAKTISGSKIHTVAAGESLYTIGEKYNVDWKKIAEVNNLSEPYSLHTGQKLIIAP